IDVDDTFKNGAFGQTTINTGTGKDSVLVFATKGDLTINGQNGQDLVSVGALGISDILGNVLITNTSSRTALGVGDSFDRLGHVVILDHVLGPRDLGLLGTISSFGVGTIQYVANDVSSVTLAGSQFNDAFFVRSTPPSGVPVILNGDTGGDEFIVGSVDNKLD